MFSLSSTLSMTVIVAGLLLSGSASGVLQNLPSALNCTQHPFVLGMTADSEFPWVHSLAGAEAAVHTFNKNGGMYGCNVTVQLIDTTNVNPQAAVMRLRTQPNFLAFTQLASSSVPTAIGLGLTQGIPVFGLVSFDETFFTPAFGFAIHHGTTFLTEMAVNLNFGLHSPSECNQYGFLYVNKYGVDVAIAAMAKKIKALGLPSPMLFPGDSFNSTENAMNVTAALKNLPADSPIPDCYLVLLFADAANSVVIDITKNTTLYDPNRTFFFGSSYIDPFREENAKEFKNYFSTRIFPHPLDTKYTIAKNFRTDLAAFEAKVSVNYSYVRSELFSNPEAMARYAQIKMILEMASRVPPQHLTPKTLLDSVYTSRLFTVDDLPMGPFSRGCSGGMTSASGPCFCNSGLRRLFLTRVDVANRSTKPVHNDPERFEANVGEFDIPINLCSITLDFLKISAHSLTIADPSITAAEGSTLVKFDSAGKGEVAAQRRIIATLERAFLKTRATALSSTSSKTTPISPITVPRDPKDTAQVAKLQARYRAGVMIASLFATPHKVSSKSNSSSSTLSASTTTTATTLPSSGIHSTLLYSSTVESKSVAAKLLPNQVRSLTLASMKYRWDDVSPDTTNIPFHEWDSGVIPFWPDLSSLVFTAAAYAASISRLSTAIVLCDTDSIAAIVARSWNTFGSAAPRTVTIPEVFLKTASTSSHAAVSSWLRSEIYAGNTTVARGGALSTPAVQSAPPFVLIVSQNTMVLEAVVTLGAEVDAVLSEHASVPGASSKGARPLQEFCLVSSEFVLEDAFGAIRVSMLPKDATTNAPRFPANIVFTSALASYSTQGVATASYATVLSALAQAFVDKGSSYSARVEAIYNERRLAVEALAIAPLSKLDCASPQAKISGTLCQANAGPNRFYIRKLSSVSIGAAVAAMSGNQNDTLTALLPASSSTTVESNAPSPKEDGAPSSTAVLFDTVFATGRPVYKALPTPSSSESNSLLIIVGSSLGGLVLLLGAFAVVYFAVVRNDTRDTTFAPKDASKPFAIVFTDIQASTMLWAHAPQHMGVALDAHHQVLRESVKLHKGYEVKTIGDSFMVAFTDPQRAVDFSIDVQRRLFTHDWAVNVFDHTYREITLDTFPDHHLLDDDYDHIWRGLRVRIGVHFGEGSIKFDETSKGFDYYGTVVNTAARVEGVGHGGQVLVTAAVATAVDLSATAHFVESIDSKLAVGGNTKSGIQAPTGVQKAGEALAPPTGAAQKPTTGGRGDASGIVASDLGPQPLRGLDEPVHLFQIVPVEFSARRFPPLRLDVENDVATDGDSLSSDSNKTALQNAVAKPNIYERASVISRTSQNTSGGEGQGQGQRHDGRHRASHGGYLTTTNATNREGSHRHSSSEENDAKSHYSTRSLSTVPTIENAAMILSSAQRSRNAAAKLQAQTQLIFGHRLLTAMFATSPTAFKSATLKKIQEKWRIGKTATALKRCIRNGLPREDAMLLMIIDKCRGTVDAANAISASATSSNNANANIANGTSTSANAAALLGVIGIGVTSNQGQSGSELPSARGSSNPPGAMQMTSWTHTPTDVPISGRRGEDARGGSHTTLNKSPSSLPVPQLKL